MQNLLSTAGNVDLSEDKGNLAVSNLSHYNRLLIGKYTAITDLMKKLDGCNLSPSEKLKVDEEFLGWRKDPVVYTSQLESNFKTLFASSLIVKAFRKTRKKKGCVDEGDNGDLCSPIAANEKAAHELPLNDEYVSIKKFVDRRTENFQLYSIG